MKTKVIMLRDYIYNPANPDVIEFRKDQQYWNLVPSQERAWLEVYYKDQTPTRHYTENDFANSNFVRSLFNEVPEWIKSDRAYKVLRSEVPLLNDAQMKYFVWKTFQDHYITERIKKKYLGGAINDYRYNEGISEEQQILDSENNFNLWYNDFISSWGNSNGGWLNGIWNVVKLAANFIIPGSGEILQGGEEIAKQAGLPAFQAKNGKQWYFPDFTRSSMYSNVNFDDSNDNTNGKTNKASINDFIIYGLIGFAIFSLMSKGKK
ncbi:MAG: hypothetical protein AB1695_14185 [Stygiobacter sp.]